MLRQILVPKSNKLVIDLPEEYINHSVEILVFSLDEQAKNVDNKDIDALFNKAKDVKIPSGINIDEIMNEGNNGLS